MKDNTQDLRTSHIGKLWLIAFCLFLFRGIDVSGHEIGENYIFLTLTEEGKASGNFTFHRDDLAEKLGIILPPGTGDDTKTVLSETAALVHAYIEENFSMGADGTYLDIHFTEQRVMQEFPQFVEYDFEAYFGALPEIIDFKHQMMYENDRMHRGMVCLAYNPVTDTHYPYETVAIVFNRNEEVQQLDLRKPINGLLSGKQFIVQGMYHIWIGIDHILFLIVLLLPAVLIRKKELWEPNPNFLKASFRILKIVTIFTVAHSITLALAALGYISISGRFVESMIAASIVLVAVNNIIPKFKEGSAIIIFSFGLFHGLGFASVMGELPFQMNNLTKVLIGFNIGVEIGQLAIVVVAFGVLYAIRSFNFYVPIVLRIGSIAAGLVATFWFFERAIGF